MQYYESRSPLILNIPSLFGTNNTLFLCRIPESLHLYDLIMPRHCTIFNLFFMTLANTVTSVPVSIPVSHTVYSHIQIQPCPCHSAATLCICVGEDLVKKSLVHHLVSLRDHGCCPFLTVLRCTMSSLDSRSKTIPFLFSKYQIVGRYMSAFIFFFAQRRRDLSSHLHDST